MLTNILTDLKTLRLKEVPAPHAGEGEVVVRVHSALTCGTDLKFYLRGYARWPMPTPFGHEFSGVLVDIGPGVSEAFKRGDAIMAVPSAPCNDCYYCQQELQNLCPHTMERYALGAFAEQILLPKHIVSQNMFKKPDHLSFAEAALLEPLSCVVYGLEQLPINKGERVAIIGTGPIGLMFVMLAKRAGASKIIAVDGQPFRLNKAQTLGANQLVNFNERNVRAAILEATEGHGVDKVFECTGQPKVWQHSIDYVRMGGSVLLFGGCTDGTQVTWDTCRLHYSQLTVKGTFHYTPKAVRKAYEILANERLPFHELITGTFDVTGLQEALERFQNGETLKLAMLTQASM